MPENPYAPPATKLERSRMSGPVAAGLFLGFLFAIPLLALTASGFVFAAKAGRFDWNYLSKPTLFLTLALSLVLIGLGWSRPSSKLGLIKFLGLSVAFSIALTMEFAVGLICIEQWVIGGPTLTWAHAGGASLILVLAFASFFYVMLMGVVVRWRVGRIRISMPVMD